ncbi:hypothetical protein AX16_009227 [Volvariella volvacea WC 439]|nr:hypothetical protein AX16_009227 [Volvariella volvacea WC 439]
MAIWYDCPSVPPNTQHDRLVALRHLIKAGIPCILWGEDALRFAHNVPTYLFDQHILVPDDAMPEASSIVEGLGKYEKAPFTEFYLEFPEGSHPGAPAYPGGIFFTHSDIPQSDRYKLYPTPRNILLIPQSYYDMNILSTSRFQTLHELTPFDPLNEKILIPKYHTFLEGLVHATMYPPTGYLHYALQDRHNTYISYLLLYRIQPPEARTRSGPLLPVEKEILSEIQTEDCLWYMTESVLGRKVISYKAIAKYVEEKNKASAVQSESVDKHKPDHNLELNMKSRITQRTNSRDCTGV